MMKVILGGIIGASIVLCIIILFPIQLEDAQEFVQNDIIENNKVINSLPHTL